MELETLEARVLIEEVIEMSESEITPDKYDSESDILLLLGRVHALSKEPGDAAIAAVVSPPAATERGAHVRLCLCFV